PAARNSNVVDVVHRHQGRLHVDDRRVVSAHILRSPSRTSSRKIRCCPTPQQRPSLSIDLHHAQQANRVGARPALFVRCTPTTRCYRTAAATVSVRCQNPTELVITSPGRALWPLLTTYHQPHRRPPADRDRADHPRPAAARREPRPPPDTSTRPADC